MTPISTRVFATALFALCLVPASLLPPSALAQTETPPPVQGGVGAPDCSRWPGSVYDAALASCVCPNGMWWNLRGEACLPREHAAGEFCSTVWPASQPYFLSGGGYRCVCAPPMLWDAQATACRAPIAVGDQDCAVEWPGTLPVLSPSGTESECRCPGGRRWDDSTRSCVGGAPVVRATHGFYDDGSGGVAPQPQPQPQPPVVQPGSAPTAPPVDGFGASPSAVPSAVPGAQPAGAGPGSPSATGAGAIAPQSNPACDSLLADIRDRAAAGDSAAGDALGMRAAVAGCDPKAISDAARVPDATR